MYDTIEIARKVAQEWANKWQATMQIFEVIGGFEVVGKCTRPTESVLREEVKPTN